MSPLSMNVMVAFTVSFMIVNNIYESEFFPDFVKAFSCWIVSVKEDIYDYIEFWLFNIKTNMISMTYFLNTFA